MSLIDQWVSMKVPIFNGIVTPDGDLFSIKGMEFSGGSPFVIGLEKLRQHMSNFEMEWTLAVKNHVSFDSDTGYVAVVGECGMGGDGFVALQKGHSPYSLSWVAFFDFSNPFESSRFESGFLVATSSLGVDWFFDLSDVPKIIIGKSAARS